MQPYTDILGQINSMIVAMGSNVPLNTFKKITELIMKNPAIFSQACDLICFPCFLGPCSEQEGAIVSPGLHVQDDGKEMHRLFPDVDFNDRCVLF